MPDSISRTGILLNGSTTAKNIEATRHLLPNESKSSTNSSIGKHHKFLATRRLLGRAPGIHSHNKMEAAGFQYTNKDDTARCDKCGLEVAGWTTDMEPFTIHRQRSSKCQFVLDMLPIERSATDLKNTITQSTSASNMAEEPLKRVQTDKPGANVVPRILVEVDTIKQVRKRTFSHWPHRSSPSSSQMIAAGFFSCNVGDRVICIYCNIICQQWTPNIDDPSEVHKTLSPKCPFVIAMLISSTSQISSVSIINEVSTNIDLFQSTSIVYTAACHPNYIEIPKRSASFTNWPNENLPPVDDLVRAGFFFSGTKTIVTCFYCNGSLQNWGANDNPMIEHARWFPNCAYAKQLCGDDLYRKIQESKRVQQERARMNDTNNGSGTTASTINGGRLNISDESTLSRLVAARLDLPISQSLLDRNFKLSIIKRCWEDQLRLKHDDFVSDSDLFIACTILQKQITHIDGKKENIIIPSVAMKKIRDQQEAEILAREQRNSSSANTNESDATDVEGTGSSTSSTNEENLMETVSQNEQVKNSKSSSMKSVTGNSNNGSSPSNPCVLCLEEEKRLACMPCGHLATCVPCGHSLRSCPICRRGIDAFVRIYI